MLVHQAVLTHQAQRYYVELTCDLGDWLQLEMLYQSDLKQMAEQATTVQPDNLPPADLQRGAFSQRHSGGTQLTTQWRLHLATFAP